MVFKWQPFWLFYLCGFPAYIFKLRAIIFGTVKHPYWGYPYKRNYATVANILKLMNFALFQLTCTVHFEIHITMNLLFCLYHVSDKFICQRGYMSSGPHGPIFTNYNHESKITQELVSWQYYSSVTSLGIVLVKVRQLSFCNAIWGRAINLKSYLVSFSQEMGDQKSQGKKRRKRKTKKWTTLLRCCYVKFVLCLN